MRSIVNLCQMLEIQMGIDLRGSDMRMPQHFLNSTQITAGLQQMGSERVSQNMRMYILMDTLLPGSVFQAMADGTCADRIAALR